MDSAPGGLPLTYLVPVGHELQRSLRRLQLSSLAGAYEVAGQTYDFTIDRRRVIVAGPDSSVDLAALPQWPGRPRELDL